MNFKERFVFCPSSYSILPCAVYYPDVPTLEKVKVAEEKEEVGQPKQTIEATRTAEKEAAEDEQLRTIPMSMRNRPLPEIPTENKQVSFKSLLHN